MPLLTWKGLRLCKHSGEITQGPWPLATSSHRADSLFTCCMRLKSNDVSLEEDTSGYGSNEVYLSLCVRGRHCTYKREPWKNPTISSQKQQISAPRWGHRERQDVTKSIYITRKCQHILFPPCSTWAWLGWGPSSHLCAILTPRLVTDTQRPGRILYSLHPLSVTSFTIMMPMIKNYFLICC